jgi:hypothetical protein
MSQRIRWYRYLVESGGPTPRAPTSLHEVGSNTPDQSDPSSPDSTDDPSITNKSRVSLLDVEKLDFGSLVVCQQRDFRSFAKFPNYLDFGRYLVKDVHDQYKCFYEVIFGDTPQKIYFDLDIPLLVGDPNSHQIPQGESANRHSSVMSHVDSQQKSVDLPLGVPRIPRSEYVSPISSPSITRSALHNRVSALTLVEADQAVQCLTEIISTLITGDRRSLNEGQLSPREARALEANTESRGHILVFTSHSESKLSYHIILDEWCVSDSKECKYFHDRVMRILPDKWHDIVDHGMYKSLQQLRIVGCHKWKDYRSKILSQDLSCKIGGPTGWTPPEVPMDNNHEYLLLLGCSLVTNTSHCHLLPSFAPLEEPKKTYFKDEIPEMELDAHSIDRAIELCAQMGQLTSKDRNFPYRFNTYKTTHNGSNLIILKRIRPSWCRVCQRIHENQDPYLVVVGRERNVYLDCRRHPTNQKIYVGSLGAVVIPYDDSIPESSCITSRNVSKSDQDWIESVDSPERPSFKKAFRGVGAPGSHRLQRTETSKDVNSGATTLGPSPGPTHTRELNELLVNFKSDPVLRSEWDSPRKGAPSAQDGNSWYEDVSNFSSTYNSVPIPSKPVYNPIPIPCPPQDLFKQLQKSSEDRERPMRVSKRNVTPRKCPINLLGGWDLPG